MGAINTKPADHAKNSYPSASIRQKRIIQESEPILPAIQNNMPTPLLNIIAGYLAYDIQISPSSTYSSIFHKAEGRIYQKSFTIARDYILTARSLDALEAEVIATPQVLLPRIKITMQLSGNDHTFEGTLEQLALINLDQTITSETPHVNMVDEGMAERLRDLRIKLLPDTLPLALDQARLALPTEDKKEEDVGAKKALNNIFEQIKQDNPIAARNIMQNYINSIRPAVITDNRYFLHLLGLIAMAFDLLFTRRKELKEQGHGSQADHYYFTTLGVINTALPFRFRQLLTSGISNLLDHGKKAARDVNVSDKLFIGAPKSSLSARVPCFYDDFGRRHGGAVFSNKKREFAYLVNVTGIIALHQQLHQRSKAFVAAIEYSNEEQDLNSVKSHRSPRPFLA